MFGKVTQSNNTIENTDNSILSKSPKFQHEDRWYTSKSLHHTPSLKALKTYNDLRIDRDFDNIDSSTIYSDNSFSLRKYDETSIARDSLEIDTKSSTNSGDYATIGTFSASGSELNPPDQNEMGSTIKLISPKVQNSWQTWSPYITTTICSTCMAAGIGNIYRLPQSTIVRGGLPFVAVYLGLTICLGLPLLFLELGIGQLAQEGVVKSWRAVPFFKGIGYVKLFMCCVLSSYYPLYIGLSLYYIIWIFKENLPFPECSKGVRMTDSGYTTSAKDGQACLKSTFLKNPFDDIYWYGMYAALLLIIWIIITIMSAWKTKSFIRSLLLLLFPVLAAYIYLLVKTILFQKDDFTLQKFFTEADWSTLNDATIWYYASVQVFFSTSIGFGTFVTNAGVLYNKVNPFWTAFGYIIINIVFGFGSVMVTQSMLNRNTTDFSCNAAPVTELQLISCIYNVGTSNEMDVKIFYFLVFLSGFISMTTLIYTLLKAITVQSKNKWKWCHIAFLLNFIGYVLGCGILLLPNFSVVHLFDHYIVGNTIMVATVIEILALISFYGLNRIKIDFEFMVGHTLSRIWLILWWIIPLFLTGMFAWAMITLPLEGLKDKEDPSWLYGIGWGIVLSTTFLIFVVGYCVISKQDGYTFKDKFRASVKPSNNWGPKDPISRLNWIQWSSKAQQGEKDFTLKRKGTRDYTRSVKKGKKMKVPSEMSTVSIQGVYKEKNKDKLNGGNIYAEVPDSVTLRHHYSPREQKNSSLPVNNENMNSLEMNRYDRNNFRENFMPNILNNVYTSSPINNPINPLSQTYRNRGKYGDMASLPKGPYIISDNEVDHICFRKYSQSNDVSEL